MIEFFSMGGYGFYVWMSMGMALVLMLLEPIYLRMKHRQLLKNIQRQQRRQASRADSAGQVES